MIPNMVQERFLSQQRTPIKSWQHLDNRGQAQRNLVSWTPTTQEVSVLVVARVWLSLSRWSCSCTGRQSNAIHVDPFVDPELIIREEDWANHKMDGGNFDPKLVAVAKQEELRKFEKLKVYVIAKEEEFKRDPKAIKIGTKWVVTNNGTKTKPMIKARLV